WRQGEAAGRRVRPRLGGLSAQPVPLPRLRLATRDPEYALGVRASGRPGFSFVFPVAVGWGIPSQSQPRPQRRRGRLPVARRARRRFVWAERVEAVLVADRRLPALPWTQRTVGASRAVLCGRSRPD